MKIGILTFHRPCNFGANLQAYSMFNYLTSLGNEVLVINYIRDEDDHYQKKVSLKQYEAHQSFVDKKIPQTKIVEDIEGLQSVVKEERFDLIVIGSDAVWRYTQGKSEFVYFAKWLFDDPEISSIPVAAISVAHMGNGFKGISDESRDAIKNCLESFSFISTRDVATKEIVNRVFFDRKDYVTCLNPDPVFNLYRFVEEKWDNQGVKEKGYFLMTLPKNWASGKHTIRRKIWFNAFKRAVHRKGYQLIEIPTPEGASAMPFDKTINYPIDPIQWFLWIKNARAFCGVRFHSIVSSISCGTPFFSLDTYGSTSSKSYALTFLGLYSKASQYDTKSKIYNLLKGSAFESFRISSYLENVRPNRLVYKLLSVDVDEIIRYRDENIGKFDTNLKRMLSIVKGRGRGIETLIDDCTGCFSCMNACPVDAISLPENAEGFYFPKVDYDKCINCGKCDKSCPALNPLSTVTTLRSYYGYTNDDRVRKESSSGGAFSAIADMILSQDGVVYGAAFDYTPEVKLTTKSTDFTDLLSLKKSKYTQAYVGLTYRDIKSNLEKGRNVFFCGTPCQVGGLKTYLGREYDNLLTADFICHGVPPVSLLKQHFNFKGLKDISSIDFRPKNRDWVDDIEVHYSGSSKLYCSPWINDEYFWLFQKYKSLRRSCYNCKYCNGRRYSDITLADFWGYKKYDESIYDKRGVSLILVNTKKGENEIKEIYNSNVMVIKEIDNAYGSYVYKKNRKSKESGYNLYERNAFYSNIQQHGYAVALTKMGYLVPTKRKVKSIFRQFIRRVFHK